MISFMYKAPLKHFLNHLNFPLISLDLEIQVHLNLRTEHSVINGPILLSLLNSNSLFQTVHYKATGSQPDRPITMGDDGLSWVSCIPGLTPKNQAKTLRLSYFP